MTFAELKVELSNRGFEHRLGFYINQAYRELCDEMEWPFLEASATGTGTVAIADLKTIIWVLDTTNQNPLKWRDRRDLLESVDATLSTTGTPTYWYLNTTSSTTTVAVYPVGTATLEVKYIKVPADLSAVGDTPVVPLRYQTIILDGATRQALYDTGDPVGAQAIEQERQAKLQTMVASLMNRNAFEPDSMQSTQWQEL